MVSALMMIGFVAVAIALEIEIIDNLGKVLIPKKFQNVIHYPLMFRNFQLGYI